MLSTPEGQLSAEAALDGPTGERPTVVVTGGTPAPAIHTAEGLLSLRCR